MARPPQHCKHASRGQKAPVDGAPASAANDAPGPVDNSQPTPVSGPSFGQPDPTPDPTKFVVTHGSDDTSYNAIDTLNREHKLAAMPFPPPRGLPEPRLTLAQVLGGRGAAAEAAAQKAGQIVFHALADSGSTRGPESQNLVADKLLGDFAEASSDQPLFLFHLGDVIYSFGESQYCYDQFYEPYRDYPAPIVALAGNHDGMVSPLATGVRSLEAFLRNFCADEFEITPEAGGLSRTAQIQPAVFFTFEAPFVRVLALYSNVLEDPGIISNDTIGTSQLDYLTAALTRVKQEKYKGALIVAHHHPAYTAGLKHGCSVDLLAQVDKICGQVAVWPHAVLSGHAHNYQRFTWHHAKTQIPYIISGNGGHGLAKLSRAGTGLRTPLSLQVPKGADAVVLENYDDQEYGYLRILANARQLRVEYHPASDGVAARTPDDSVTVDLASRTLTVYAPE